MSGFQPFSCFPRSPLLKLRLLTGPRAGRQLRVSDTKPVSIGRRKGRLRLHDSRVSKNHAEIYFANDVWVLRDLGSANGTYVNRRKASGLVELEPGDIVQMGRVLFKIVRCDMIGMDTQPFSPESDSDEGLLDSAVGLAGASGADDDFDLDALFGDDDASASSDDSSGIEAVATSAKEGTPQADTSDVDTSSELPQDQADDEALEPMSVAFDEPVDDDDSFFADLGEATDTSGGKDIAVHQEDADDEIKIEDESAGEPLELAASESDAPRVEAAEPIEDVAEEEDDPFLPNASEEDSEETGDLISLDDESGMGSRSSGTTLLTAAHDDGTPMSEMEAKDEIVLDQAEVQATPDSAEPEDDDEDDAPPALVGLALEHAPPQQPKGADDDSSPDEIEASDESAFEIEAIDDPVDESKEAFDDAAAEVGRDDEPFDVLDEPIDPFAGLPTDGPADAPEEALAASPVGDVDSGIDQSEQGAGFDIDAAFNELSEGLDDSLSGSPAVQDLADQDAQDELKAEAEPTVEQEHGQAADPLVGSQLDVDFIKDALSQLEDEMPSADVTQDDAKPQASASQADALTSPPVAPDEPYMQSPPPGLTTSGINPTSVNPPVEPRRSYTPKRGGSGAGRWTLTLLLFLGIGGVGGWYINQNYDRFIGGRTTDDVSNDSSTPGGPAKPNDLAATPGEQVTPPIASPTDPVVGAEPRDLETAGPNPFGSGPSVIGSDALEGLTRDSTDDRPLDPPRGTSPGTVTGSDTIRQPTQPNQPTVDGANPTVKDPTTDFPGPGDQTTVTPAVTDRPPAKIVFLVDASGSLVDSLPQMLVWLNEALQTVEQDEQFAVYFFKSDKPIAIKPEGLQTPSRPMLAKIAQDWLNADRVPVFPSGRSNPSQAITQALSLEPTDIYLLSDDAFAFHQGDTDAKAALDLVKQALGDKAVRVHGVQFFYRSEKSILETLADEYDGTFEFVRENVVPNADPIDLLEELGGE